MASALSKVESRDFRGVGAAAFGLLVADRVSKSLAWGSKLFSESWSWGRRFGARRLGWGSCRLVSPNILSIFPIVKHSPVSRGLLGTEGFRVEGLGRGFCFSGVPFSFPRSSSPSSEAGFVPFDLFLRSRGFLLEGSSTTSSSEEAGVVSCSWSRRASRDSRSFFASCR